MDNKQTFKLMGGACAARGQYTFYKAFRCRLPDAGGDSTGSGTERILALGDFFFLKLWQDSELLSIGEVQLVWTDRVSEQTLVSLRLYFLPENTPDGRNQHGQDEVLVISDKVVVRLSELVPRLSAGREWRRGLRAVWRGACARPPATHHDTPEPLHASRLSFTDIDKEKRAIEDVDAPGVAVFSYPRYCRYRALLARLEGLQTKWLRDTLVAALGGYAAPTTNTRVLFCRDTFEYPELEGHELVANHLAPKLKGRPRGRRPRRANSDTGRDSDSSSDRTETSPPRVLRNGTPSTPGTPATPVKVTANDADTAEDRVAERTFMQHLRTFHRDRATLKHSLHLKDVSLRRLYTEVMSRGGYEAVCLARGWNSLHDTRARAARRHYERVLLPFEKYERRNGSKWYRTRLHNGTSEVKGEPTTIATIDITRESPTRETHDDKCETASPDMKQEDKKEPVEEKPASQLNQEFLDSLPPKEDAPDPPKITVKPVEKLIEKSEPKPDELPRPQGLAEYLPKQSLTDLSAFLLEMAKKNAESTAAPAAPPQLPAPPVDSGHKLLAEITAKQNLEASWLREMMSSRSGATEMFAEMMSRGGLIPPTLAQLGQPVSSLPTLPALPNGTCITLQNNDKTGVVTSGGGGTVSPPARPAGRSSLRNVRVKPTRSANTPHTLASGGTTPLRPDSGSSSPPVTSSVPAGPTNFGINYPQVTSSTRTPHDQHSDDEIIEVPYKPKTPEIIDLDEYEEGGQSARHTPVNDDPHQLKKRKLDLLKERGLEVTAVPPDWPAAAAAAAGVAGVGGVLGLAPAVQQQIMTQASFFQMYNTFMPSANVNGLTPPKVIQGKSIYGSPGAEKTVYGNPKDPFMPPPHVLAGAPPVKKPLLNTAAPPASPQDILDLSAKILHKPAVEIVRVPNVPSPVKPSTPQNLSKNYSMVDGKAVVGSNLEITLVSPKQPSTPPKSSRPKQKRSSTGQFMSNKSTGSRESPGYKTPASPTVSTSRAPEFKPKATNIVIPSYQMSNRGDSDVSPTSSTSSREGLAFTSSLLQNAGGSLLQNSTKNPPSLAQIMEMQAKTQANLASYMDPSVYMNAVYSGLAGQLSGLSEQLSGQLSGLTDQQLAVYQNLVSSRLLRYPGLLNVGGVTNTPTSKN